MLENVEKKKKSDMATNEQGGRKKLTSKKQKETSKSRFVGYRGANQPINPVQTQPVENNSL